MTVDEAAAHEVAERDAQLAALRELDDTDWIVSDRGYHYRVVELT